MLVRSKRAKKNSSSSSIQRQERNEKKIVRIFPTINLQFHWKTKFVKLLPRKFQRSIAAALSVFPLRWRNRSPLLEEGRCYFSNEGRGGEEGSTKGSAKARGKTVNGGYSKRNRKAGGPQRWRHR